LLDCGVVEGDCAEILNGVVCGADVGMDEEEEGSFAPLVADYKGGGCELAVQGENAGRLGKYRAVWSWEVGECNRLVVESSCNGRGGFEEGFVVNCGKISECIG
jgi:hypothetical protein